MCLNRADRAWDGRPRMEWEHVFREEVAHAGSGDPAHDLSHFERVVKTAKKLAREERADLAVVVPAAWLHDFVQVAKDSPLRAQASRLSAEKAIEFLRSHGYPAEHFGAIAHAIEAHSFSAGIEARTLEARVVQDADRLDGLGAIGLARLFVVAGLLKRPLYNEDDPFCARREPDDSRYTIDHIYRKLMRVAQTLTTEAGRREGARRLARIERFLGDLADEV